MDDPSKNDRDFFRIATWASVIGMSVVGAFMGSIQGLGLKFSLGFSIWTVHGAIIGGVLAWGIWRVARAKAEQAQRQREHSSDVKTTQGERHNH
jgi:hypothetical protein